MTETVSVMDMVNNMAAKPKKTKSSKPGIQLTSDTQIMAFIGAKRDYDNAKALMDTVKQQLVAQIAPLRFEICQKQGVVVPSISVNNLITYTQTKRYSNVPEECDDMLREAFTHVEYDSFFSPVLKIGLSEDSANDENVLAELFEKLGAEFMADHFDISRNLVVTERFHTAFTTDKDVHEKAQPFVDAQVIRPYSASIKVK